MARIRTLKPSFWTDEKLTQLPRDVRLTYIGLISHADDDGRLKGDPRLVKAAVYPLDDDVTPDVVEKHLARLAKAGRIVRYRVDGAAYAALPKFREHQRISHPLKSDLPEPPEGASEGARNDCGGCAEDVRSDCGASVSGSGSGSGSGMEVEGDARDDALSADADPPNGVVSDKAQSTEALCIAEGIAWWRANVGKISDRVFRRVTAGSIEAHGWDAVFRGLQCYAAKARAKGKTMKLEWFVAEDARWIAEEADEHRLIGANGNEAELMAYVTSSEYLHGARR